METATETERKYDVSPDFALPELAGALPDLAGTGESETHDLDATYYDTEDLRLARKRRTLRRRTGGTDAGWHLKTPGDGSSRTEHRLPLDGDDVPGEMRDEVRAIIRDRELRPVARLRTRRVETPLCAEDGRVLALIAQDQVVADTDAGSQQWQEVEVELVDGDAKVLKAVERRLLKAGAAPASGPSKLARALGDRVAAGATPVSEDPVLRYVQEQRDAIQAYDPGARRGDPDSVHKMRVATRRLRSTLKTFKRSFPEDSVEFLKPELKWLAGQLGEVRDGQVLEHKLLDAVEVFAPNGGKPAKQLVSRLTDLQDVLGHHQDSTVAREILRELSREVDDAFPYGILYARQEQVGRDTVGNLPGVIAASRESQLRNWLT